MKLRFSLFAGARQSWNEPSQQPSEGTIRRSALQPCRSSHCSVQMSLVQAGLVASQFLSKYYESLANEPKNLSIFFAEDSSLAQIDEEQNITEQNNVTGSEVCLHNCTFSWVISPFRPFRRNLATSLVPRSFCRPLTTSRQWMVLCSSPSMAP